MNDDFNRQLWELASNAPDLQQAMLKASAGYTIPTGNVLEELADPSYPVPFPSQRDRDAMAKIVRNAMRLPVSELSEMLDGVRSALILKEERGETLNRMEKTLKDLDLNRLALFILLLHMKYEYLPAQEKGGNP